MPGAMRINTQSGPHYSREGTKMCQILPIFFIPLARS